MVNPVVVEVQRAGAVESIHRGSIAVVDPSGRVVFSCGDIEAAVYPRSAVKPLQALPLIISTAADRLGLDDAEVALACGSHGGEAVHVAGVASMLAKAGCGVVDLECGTHWPLDEAAARGLAARGEPASPLHNNCSGKHAGFIDVAVVRGHTVRGYAAADHPVMREVTAALATATGARLDASNRGIDGCSIPTFAVPLRSLAMGFARLGTGHGMPDEFAAAAARIRSAITASPVSIAGANRFDTWIASASKGAVLTKAGAEGVAAGTIPSAGIGVAVKIDDGAGRAAESLLAAVVHAMLDGASSVDQAVLAGLQERMEPVLRNWQGLSVGRIRPVISLRR